MNCRKEENLKTCPCSELECENRGVCCECIRYHREKGELPGCYFSKEAEATRDRSIKNFIKNYGKG